MNTKIILSLVFIAFTSSCFSGCALLKKRVEKKENVEYKISGKNKTSISIRNTNGEIKVTNSNDTLGIVTINAEKVEKVKLDDMDKPIDNLVINIDSSGNDIKITTDYNKKSFGLFHNSDDGKVNYSVTVPANLKVDLDNTNGSITLTGLSNDIKVDLVNGSSTLSKCSGNISIDGTNGRVSGNFDSTKGIKIDVVNGAVKLGGLKDISARVNASTVNGKVKFNNLNFTNLTAEKRSLSGALGTGSALIKINSVNGSITLDANDVSLAKDSHNDDFHFTFDFDDNDNNTHNKIRNDTAKSLDSPKAK